MEHWRPSEKQGVVELHRRFCSALGNSLVEDQLTPDALAAKPLDVACHSPLPPGLRVYLFNGTDHPSERKAGDYRIQLRLPGQHRRTRGRLVLEPGHLLLLAGYVSEFDVFVLWDARAHEEFPYSKGVQVGAATVHRAAIYGLAEQQREVRSTRIAERVVAVRSDRLTTGVRRREELSRSALLGEPPEDWPPSVGGGRQ